MAAPTKCTILWQNLADGKTYSIWTGADANFPASNLHDNDIHTVARTTDATISRYFVIDLGASPTVYYDMVGIAGCNSSAASSLYASNGAGSDPTAFTYGTNVLTFSTTTKCGVFYWSTTQSNRYVAVRFNDPTLSFCEIGEMWIGMKLQLAVNPQIPMDLIRQNEVTELITGGGQRWTYNNYSKKGYGLNFIEDLSPTGAGSFASLDIMYYNSGVSLPFFFHLQPSDDNEPPMFVHTTGFDFSIAGKDKRPGRWTIEEEL